MIEKKQSRMRRSRRTRAKISELKAVRYVGEQIVLKETKKK